MATYSSLNENYSALRPAYNDEKNEAGSSGSERHSKHVRARTDAIWGRAYTAIYQAELVAVQEE